ncbi:transcriptional regulator [Defluviimonas sp. 20V17]|nr:helix-turn-helix transcriptional regulator [Allgaiera indica]KDB02550.1 transcriptional regulator [Defluviimonas sp. 20V17]SDW97013.1 DNA-binding transcriptional regulator, CsgD family [Allgaiera indica]
MVGAYQGEAKDAQGPVLTWLDLAPDGRILFAEAMAQQVVGPAVRDSGIFVVEPESAFFAALARAADGTCPAPSVLRPEDHQSGSVMQVNILPLGHRRIRVVLFVQPRAASETAVAGPQLTAREQDVLELLAGGLRRDRIAWTLGISLPTVDLHARNLRRKLSALTTSEAVACAVRIGLLGIS